MNQSKQLGEEISRRRAYRTVGLCEELFDVAAALSQLFGVSTGRVVLRAAAAVTGAEHLVVPAT